MPIIPCTQSSETNSGGLFFSFDFFLFRFLPIACLNFRGMDDIPTVVQSLKSMGIFLPEIAEFEVYISSYLAQIYCHRMKSHMLILSP